MKIVIGFFLLIVLIVISLLIYSHFRTGYKIKGNKVYFITFEPGGLGFKETEMPDSIDIATFKSLSDIYSLDKNAVYRMDRILRFADPNSFSLIDHPSNTEVRFSKDSKNVYEYGLVLENADPQTFIPLEGRYAKDAKLVFYDGKIIENADPLTFKVIKDAEGFWETAKDKNNIYDKNAVRGKP